MLFNSPEFLFAFLPLVALGFHLLARSGAGRGTRAWLVLASLVYYGWWDPRFLPLLLASLVFNYLLARRIRSATGGVRRGGLIVGICANLALLGAFKYVAFLAVTAGRLSGLDFNVPNVILPLAISFFTFEQIAYLVDTAAGRTEAHPFVDYALFVAFFPQLIAGPIMHPHEMLPQFRRRVAGIRLDDLSIGATLFLAGLAKKVLVADSIAPYATSVFDAAALGTSLGAVEAWQGALAYTFQLYFDFSGYSDMAIGLGRVFGVRIPLNFDSPYQATSIIDFWRRWHISLSRWLRDYLYIPLGGSRRGRARRYRNLLLTMLLGGLWHGAGWTFVIWGGLHGLYLAVAHLWRESTPEALRARLGGPLGRAAGRTATLLAVVVAWVFFRAEGFPAAGEVLTGMAGLHGVAVPASFAALLPLDLAALGVPVADAPLAAVTAWLWIGALLLATQALPNPERWMAGHDPVLEPLEPLEATGPAAEGRFAWRATPLVGATLGVLLFLVVRGFFAAAPSEFLYFDF